MDQKPKLLDQMRQVLRTGHYSLRTERSYVDWARRYILFHQKRHPLTLGEAEVAQFLTHLAVDGKVAASHPKPSPACNSLPVSQSPEEAVEQDRECRTCQKATTAAYRAHAGRGPAGIEPYARDASAHGPLALRLGAASLGGLSASFQG